MTRRLKDMLEDIWAEMARVVKEPNSKDKLAELLAEAWEALRSPAKV